MHPPGEWAIQWAGGGVKCGQGPAWVVRAQEGSGDANGGRESVVPIRD